MERTTVLLQQLLRRLGYLADPFAAGTLDAATTAALHRFQQLHAIASTAEPDDDTWKQVLAADDKGECVVTGRVTDPSGPVAAAAVVVRDRELGDAAAWPVLGTAHTDDDGRFAVLYVVESVRSGDRVEAGGLATADLVFELRDLSVASTGFDLYRLPSDELVGDADKALGLQARRLEDVRIVVRTTERRTIPGATEFERLLAAFSAVWPKVSPASLDDHHDEPAFVARELGEPPDRIDALVSALRLRHDVFEDAVSAEILYGLARSDLKLAGVARLGLATSSQLKNSILQAVERQIIPLPPGNAVEEAIRGIHQKTSARVLAEPPAAGGAPYLDVLKSALPTDAQRAALVQAAAGRESDPPAMWQALRAHPAFAGTDAVEKAQFALQLDAVANGHLPLIEALQQEHGVTSIRGLLDLDARKLRATVGRANVGVPDGMPGDNDGERADAYVAGLVGQVQLAFPTETVARVVGRAPSGTAAEDEVRDGVVDVLARATGDAMRAGATAFDIRSTHVDGYMAAQGATVLAGVAAATRPAVVSALKRSQRLFRVSTGADAFDWLLRKGYRSAAHIAGIPRSTFMQSASDDVGEAQASMIHARARAAAGTTLAAYMQVRDGLDAIIPLAAANGEDRVVTAQAVVAAVAAHAPGWAGLFGENAMCACSHCLSMYGPAAYLVDVLHFLDQSAAAVSRTALDVLLRRRPDLAQLALTCENTDTVIPYVDLVNEVLESLVVSLDAKVKGSPFDIPAFDTDGASADDQRAAPQHTNWAAYVTPAGAGVAARLDRAVYPASLPFDAPLLAARAYLRHLGVERAELMAAFADDGPLTDALAAERLGLAPAMFEAICAETVDGTPAGLATAIDDRYGLPEALPALGPGASGAYVAALKRKLAAAAAAGAALAVGDEPGVEPFDAATQAEVQAFQNSRGLPASGTADAATWDALAPLAPPFAVAMLPHVPVFLAQAGVTFDELVQLLQTRFVNPEAATLETVRRLQLPGDELLAFVKAGFQSPGKRLAEALKDAGITADFGAWAQARFAGAAGARLGKTLLIDGPTEQSCDLTRMTLRHWDASDRLPGEDEWLRLERFIRLWRALAWSIDDLDLALLSLGAADISATVLRQLAQIGELGRQVELPVAQVVALWADPDPARPGSLYAQRFSNRSLLRLDPAFQPDWAGDVLVNAAIGDHLSALQAGLRLSGADLAVLRDHLGLSADGSALTPGVVGSLLRSTTLARALHLNVLDLVRLLDLTGLQPFVAPTDDWPALRFVREVRRLQQSKLTAAQLAFALGDFTKPEPDAARDRLLASIRDGLLAIVADFDPAAETDGSLTRRALASLGVAPALADAALAVVLGTDRSTAPLPAAAVPAPAIPPQWAERLAYEASPPALRGLGALTDAERTVVEGFSSDAGYLSAVARLHAAPRAVLQELTTALDALGVAAPTAAALLKDSLTGIDAAARDQVVRTRLHMLLEAILRAVRKQLGRALVAQALAPVQPNAATLRLLLEGERAPGTPTVPAGDLNRPLLDDFLDLAVTADTTAAAQGYELLARLGQLIEPLALGADDLAALVHHLVALRPSAGRLCGYDDWAVIAGYARVRAGAGQSAGLLASLWDAATVEAARPILASLFGWPERAIDDLMAAAGLGLGLADVRQPAALERLAAAGRWVAALGVPVAQAAAWARLPIAPAAADEARRAVKARYDEPAWLEAAPALGDPLREARRAALVAYLVPRLGVGDANGLYQLTLIDVEMSPCMMTSRIKQAISSAQLFVQRCLLNLDPDVPPDAVDAQHWEWMKNYRVWEANRKVLFYPENWILPELRDDKTPIFRELEQKLLQNDVTDANVEKALADYLQKLDAVAKLDIVAMCVQQDFEPDEKLRTVVHLFGRTPNPPQVHHYRRYVVTHNGTALWTPWEAMPVDVRGTLIAPVVFERRLYVFWANFTPKEASVEIGLSWSEYRDTVWSPVQATETDQALSIATSRPYGDGKLQNIIKRLETRLDDGQLRINCMSNLQLVTGWLYQEGRLGGFNLRNQAYTEALGGFTLHDCNLKVMKDENAVKTVASSAAVLQLHDEQAAYGPAFFKPVLYAKLLSFEPPLPAGLPILNTIYDSTEIVEEKWVHSEHSFFVFKDGVRTYLAQMAAEQLNIGIVLADADQAYPRRASPGASRSSSAQLAADNRGRAAADIARADAATRPWDIATSSVSSIVSASTSVSAESSVQAGPGSPSAKGAAPAIAAPRRIVSDLPMAGNYDVTVRFEPAFHPFSCTYIKALHQYGINGVLKPENQNLRFLPDFRTHYAPDAAVAPPPYPASGVDFGATDKPGFYRSTAFSVYNWELFFHLPMLVADRFIQNRRFEDARRWLHYVFDPTDGSGGYWKFVPLQATPGQSIEEWLKQVASGDPDAQRQVLEWKDHPFEPHLIARMRVTAYKKYVVMKYLDNLIAWGDSLFELDTIESINSATQLYVMCADLLGPRPETIRPRAAPEPMTFAQMRHSLDELSDAWAEAENDIPYISGAGMAPADETVGLLGINRSLYFCLPPNDKLLAYWDTVADRLYKVRHCMNLAGVVRQLPLFEPAIDPALLVAAAAQGLDIGAVLADLGAPLPAQRFRVVFRQAMEACGDLKALGAALLSALERKDVEELALLKATHETAIRRKLLESRKLQETEAKAQVDGLMLSRNGLLERLNHFSRLMGKPASAPKLGDGMAMVAYAAEPVAQESGVFLIEEEVEELQSSHSAQGWQDSAGYTEVLASVFHALPMITLPLGVTPLGPISTALGGSNFGSAFNALARFYSAQGARNSYDAAHAGKMGSYKRRQQDFAHQANLAAREIMALDKQIIAAAIRSDAAKLATRDLEAEIVQLEAVEHHYRSKFTNADLWGWMQGRVSALYYQSYQLTCDLARRAERCFRFEGGLASSNYIAAGGWDSLHKGLLAGESLQLQLRQLERAQQEQERRWPQITKHVSLRQHAPLALLLLKETGRCEVELPELIYDMDHPGHYMRRIKSVSVTIPAVVGPYTSVNATLTLLSNEMRASSELSKQGGKYERDIDNDDDRFVADLAPIQMIVTSTGQNDSGLFDTNFNDDLYLPFEGAGAASRWRIEMDPDCNRFDPATVADVVLNIRYTARHGGARLAQMSKAHWKSVVGAAENAPLSRLFSLKHDFPGEWHRLRTTAQANGDHAQTIALTSNQFPYLFVNRELHVGRVDLLGVPAAGKQPKKLPELRQPDKAAVVLGDGAPLGTLLHRSAPVDVIVKDGSADASWQLFVASADVPDSLDQLDDLMLVCHYDVEKV